jgi:hypothetical protein
MYCPSIAHRNNKFEGERTQERQLQATSKRYKSINALAIADAEDKTQVKSQAKCRRNTNSTLRELEKAVVIANA